MAERNELIKEAKQMTLAKLLSRKGRCQRLHDSADDCHTFIVDELDLRLRKAMLRIRKLPCNCWIGRGVMCTRCSILHEICAPGTLESNEGRDDGYGKE